MALIKFRWIQRINKNATTKLASRLQFVFPLIYLERWRKWNREEQNIHEINQKKHLYFDVVKNCHSIKFSRLLFWAGEYGKYLIPFEPIRLQDFRIRRKWTPLGVNITTFTAQETLFDTWKNRKFFIVFRWRLECKEDVLVQW